MTASMFDTIEYLKTGNPRQRKAYDAIVELDIMSALSDYDPILVGTIPINLDIENSDLDFICYAHDTSLFYDAVERNFCQYDGFDITTKSDVVIARFTNDDFEWEIYGAHIPTREQMGYRHLMIENKLLLQYGDDFRRKIIALKQQGYKTEPAFAHVLGLSGDPYQALLQFESIPRLT